MRRLGLTVLAMVWILAAIIAWAWLGTTIHDHVASVAYWVFSWLPGVIVIVVPFAIYRDLGDKS